MFGWYIGLDETFEFFSSCLWEWRDSFINMPMLGDLNVIFSCGLLCNYNKLSYITWGLHKIMKSICMQRSRDPFGFFFLFLSLLLLRTNPKSGKRIKTFTLHKVKGVPLLAYPYPMQKVRNLNGTFLKGPFISQKQWLMKLCDINEVLKYEITDVSPSSPANN